MINTALLITKRTEAGLSQRQLAKHAGVNRETIRRLEHGADSTQVTIRVLERMAKAVRVTPELLSPPAGAHEDRSERPKGLDPSPLDRNAARLLRRVQRGDDVRRSMTQAERQFIVPDLLNRQIIDVTAHGLHLTPTVSDTLSVAIAT